MTSNYSNNNTHPFKILQWNCRSFFDKQNDIDCMIMMDNPDCFLFCETWTTDNQNINKAGYTIVRYNRPTRGGGVMVMIKNHFFISQIELHNCNIEAVAIKAKIGNQIISLVSTYFPPNMNIAHSDLDNLFAQIPPPRIIGGDFNAHHLSWGSYKNENADSVFYMLDEFDLTFLNTGCITRVACPPGQNSAIDLTLCSSSMALNMVWQTSNNTFGSDHIPIVCEYKYVKEPADKSYKDILRGIKWRKFAEIFTTHLQNQQQLSKNTPTCLEQYSEFLKILYESIEKSKNNNTTCKKRRQHWWDDECFAVFKERREAFKLLRTTGTKQAFLEHSRMCAKVKQVFLKKKRESWYRFCESISSDQNMHSFWRMVRHYNNQSRSNNQINPQDINWPEVFLEALTPPWVPIQEPLFFCSPNSIDLEYLCKQFSIHEFENALSNTKNTAAGLDGLKYEVFKHMGLYAKYELLKIFNGIFRDGLVPFEWKNVKLIPVLKPNKDPRNINSRRPIKLLNCARKLFEKMIQVRLEWWVESNNILPCFLYGFRRNKSTSDCLNILISNIISAFKKKNSLVAVFIDLTSAFDNVRIDILCQKLQMLGLPAKMIKIIWELMSMNNVQVFLNGNTASSIRTSFIGLPQGSVLSPILFNLYVMCMSECLSQDVKIIQFADDTTIFISGSNVDKMENKLQQTLNKVYHWCFGNGLAISSEKSNIVTFSNKHAQPHVTLNVNNVRIPVVAETKYLGVIFDRKLKLSSHNNYILAKANKSVNFIKMVTSTKWGGHPKTGTSLFQALVRSVLEYCPPALLLLTKSHFLKAERVQWLGLRSTSGCMKSTPTNALHILNGVLPLQLRLKWLQTKYYLRCIFKKENAVLDAISELNQIWPDLVLSKIYNLSIHTSSNVPKSWKLFNFEIVCNYLQNVKIDTTYREEMLSHKSSLSNAQHQAIFNKVMSCYQESQHIIYTDGTKSEHYSGFAAVHKNCFSSNWSTSIATTIFENESYAILEALRHVLSTHSTGDVLLVCDSLSVINCIVSKKHVSCLPNAILSIRESTIILQSRGQRLCILWVPSHVQIQGNEQADQLAATSTGATSYNNEDFGRSLRFLKTKIILEWQTDWDSSNKGRYLYRTIPSVKLEPLAKIIPSLSTRLQIGIFARLYSGHTRTLSHLKRIGVTNDETCECRTATQDCNHIFFDCPHLNRTSFMNHINNQLKLSPPYAIESILSYLLAATDPTATIFEILHFIKTNKVKL